MRMTLAERDRMARMVKQRDLATSAELVRVLVLEEERRGKFLRGLKRGDREDARAAARARPNVIALTLRPPKKVRP